MIAQSQSSARWGTNVEMKWGHAAAVSAPDPSAEVTIQAAA